MEQQNTAVLQVPRKPARIKLPKRLEKPKKERQDGDVKSPLQIGMAGLKPDPYMSRTG